MGKLINIDNGGTLTDIWVLDGERSYHTKTLTTPYDLSKCFFDGLKKASKKIYGREDLKALLQSTDHIRYSTTQGTNALVQKKGPRLGLLINTADARKRLADAQTEDEMLALMVSDRTVQIDTSLTGDDYTKSVVNAVNELGMAGASRLVVCFDGPDYAEQEARFKRTVLRAFPRHLLGTVPMVYASEVVDELDYARRSWSALYGAFLHPAMELFLYHAESGLRSMRVENPLLIYRNDGGASRVAKTIALKTYSSGPRGGAEGALAAARHYDMPHLLMLDVGGTSSDFAEVREGKLRASRYGEVEGIECAYPMCDIVSIGAGGGSIFRVSNGEITVGPDSVGGAPGPACFAMGGTEATITDALLVMRLLDPATYFDGGIELDSQRALDAITRNIADPLGLTPQQAVQAMISAFAEKVAQGLQTFSEISKESVLMAFGGAGPMNVLSCAEAANIDTVLIPRLAAVYSAYGIAYSNISYEYRSTLTTTDGLERNGVQEALLAQAARDMFAEGIELEDCDLQWQWQQAGQSYELKSAGDALPASAEITDGELVLTAAKPLGRVAAPGKAEWSCSDAIVADTRVLDLPDGLGEVPVYRVDQQVAGASGSGPCIIEEDFYTCRVLPDWQFEFTDQCDILLRKRDNGKAS